MPTVLRIQKGNAGGFYKLQHSYSRRFVDFIRLGIKPISCRQFDPQTQTWSVHSSKLAHVISGGLRYFDHVDWSEVPNYLREEIDKILKDWKKGNSRHKFNACKIDTAVKKDPFLSLFLIENAPWEVVKAAYKALAQMHHPDVGGDPKKFMEIQEAYEELKKKYDQ